MIRVIAKSQSGSVHTVTGYVTGGVKCQPPDKPGSPGKSTPFPSVEFAIDHLEKNGWTVLEVQRLLPEDDDARID